MTLSMTDYVLPVDKPVGPTSHDIVQRARRSLDIRRVGHTGTLDPFASGLLVLCVGRATRISEYVTELPKRYEAEALLGRKTDTDDREGVVISSDEGWVDLDPAMLENSLARFRGTIDQVPPQFSAKKVGGVAVHRLARQGQSVELEPCRVTVHELELLEVDLPRIRFALTCSSGTYVRSLARDLGDALGVGAHLTELRRTGIGHFDVGAALAVDDLDDVSKLPAAAVTPLRALGHLDRVDVSEAEVACLALGQAVSVPGPVAPGPIVVSGGGELVAIAEVRDGMLRPRKVFVS